MKKLIAILALALLTPAFPSDLTHKFGLGGSVGFPIPVFGNNFNSVADPEWSASVHGRYHFDQFMGLDLSVSKEGFKDTPMNFENINLLGLWRMLGVADFTPIFGLGAGVTRIKDYLPGSAKLSLLARGGIEYNMMPSLVLGALVDYQYVSKIMGKMPDGPAHVLNPQLALTFYFGADKTEKTEPAPAPEKVSSAESDVVSVASAATERKEMIDENKPVMTIEFDSSMAEIKPHYIDQIKKVAEQLKGDNTLSGIVEGYADSTGPADLNDKLSKRRAEAVQKKLIEFGVDQKRLRAEGFGAGRPIADNRTSEGRQKNRRASVIISIIKTNISDTM
ncbi:MAG: OmpA family protein [Bacteriovorax sp.]|nr:OmpA family protein [Bacteriovorax sp.]